MMAQYSKFEIFTTDIVFFKFYNTALVWLFDVKLYTNIYNKLFFVTMATQYFHKPWNRSRLTRPQYILVLIKTIKCNFVINLIRESVYLILISDFYCLACTISKYIFLEFITHKI